MSEDTQHDTNEDLVLVGRRPRTWIWWALGGLGALGMLVFLIVPRGGSSDGDARSGAEAEQASADPSGAAAGASAAAATGTGDATTHGAVPGLAGLANGAARSTVEAPRSSDDPNVIGGEAPLDPEEAVERAIAAAVAPWKERAIFAEKRLAALRRSQRGAKREGEQRRAEQQARLAQLEAELGAERRSRIPPPPPPAEQVLQALRPVFSQNSH